MIVLDNSRNVVHNSELIDIYKNEEFLVVDDPDNRKYHFEKGHSDKIIYLQEHDLFYSIKDLKKGLLFYAPIRCGDNSARFVIRSGFRQEIPNLMQILMEYGISVNEL